MENTDMVKLLVAAIAAAGVAGCALQPAYQRPSAAPGAYPSGEAYAVRQGATTTLPAAQLGWREFLPDPRLQQLVALALQHNQDLRVALLNVEKARAQSDLARASLMPQLGVAAGVGAVRTPGGAAAAQVSHNAAAQLAASWEPDLFGRLHSMSQSAFEQYLASDYAHRAASILLVSQVVAQDLTLRAADAQLDVTRKTLSAASAAYQLMQVQANAGNASELALRLAETSVEQAQAGLAAQVRSRAQAVNALVLLLGAPLPDERPAPLPLDGSPLLAGLPSGLPSDLLERRPDILQAEAMLRAANDDIGTARAAFFPDISLTGVFGTASDALGGLFAAGSGQWSYVAGLAAPVFDGGANRARLDLASLQKEVEVAQYRHSVQLAFREVADALAARSTYSDQLAALHAYAATQQRRLQLAELRYHEGIDNYLNVLAARTDLYAAQQALINARLNQLVSSVDLYRALGGGWREHSAVDGAAATKLRSRPAEGGKA